MRTCSESSPEGEDVSIAQTQPSHTVTLEVPHVGRIDYRACTTDPDHRSRVRPVARTDHRTRAVAMGARREQLGTDVHRATRTLASTGRDCHRWTPIHVWRKRR